MKNIKHIITTLLLISSIANLQAQNWLWARDGGTSVSASARLLTVSPNSNIYIYGGFGGTFALDSVNISTGQGNGYILSANTNGVFLKGTEIIPNIDIHGQPSALFVSSLNTDLQGSIYLTGGVGGAVSFDTAHAPVYPPGYLAKFNSDLHGLSVKGASSTVYSAAFDSGKNTYLAGTITDAVTHIDTFTLYNNSPNPIFKPKMFLAKLDSTGKCLWTKQGLGGRMSAIQKIVLNNDNVYMYGYIDSCTSFDTANICGFSNFIIKTDRNGGVKWVSTYTHLGSGYFTSIDVDANSNCYVIGGFDSTMYLPSHTLTKAPNSLDNGFIAKYDSTGAILWVKQFSSDSLFHFDAMHTDDAGNTYALGYFSKTGVFLDDTITAQSGRDMFITRLSSSGNYLGIKSLPIGVDAKDIAEDASGNAIVTGDIKTGTTYFDTIALTCTGQSNFFLVKLSAITGGSSGTRTLPSDNRLTIYANPNNGTFTIEVPQGIVASNRAQLGIYNSTGGVVKEESADISNNKLSVDIGTVQKGIFTVTLSSGGKKYSGRVVVE